MIPLSPDHNHTPQTFSTARLHSSIIFDFLPEIQILGERLHTCVCVCARVHCACRLSRACSWARWREHSLLSIWQLKTSHSKRPAQIVRSRNPRKLRGGVEGGGDKGVSPGGVHFLSNEAVRQASCWQKARISRPPAYTQKPPVRELNEVKSFWI